MNRFSIKNIRLPMMGEVVCHPDNARLLRAALDKLEPPGEFGTFPFALRSPSIRIREAAYVDRDQPTGRIIGPDGVPRDRKGFRAKWLRFAELEESDLSWALALGIVSEEREPVFYLMSSIRTRPFWDAGLPVFDPRLMLMTTTV